MVKLKLNNGNEFVIKGDLKTVSELLNKNTDKYISFTQLMPFGNYEEIGIKYFYANSILTFDELIPTESNIFES